MGVAPTVSSYNAAITACGKSGKWEEALALLKEMPAAGVAPDSGSLSAAISACHKADRGVRAAELVEEIMLLSQDSGLPLMRDELVKGVCSVSTRRCSMWRTFHTRYQVYV